MTAIDLRAHEDLSDSMYDPLSGGHCALLHDTWLRLEENGVEANTAWMQKPGARQRHDDTGSHLTWPQDAVDSWRDTVGAVWSSLSVPLQSFVVGISARFDGSKDASGRNLNTTTASVDEDEEEEEEDEDRSSPSSSESI